MSQGAAPAMSLKEAQHVAALAYSHLERHGSRLVVAGSIRRGARTCKDVEIVLEPMMNGDLFGDATPILEPLLHSLRMLGTITKQGDRYVQVTDLCGKKGVKLDLFLVHPPAQWGSIVAIRTGPWQLSRFAVKKMRSRGYRHDQGHVISMKTGALIPTPNERDFFDLAGLPFVAPDQREELARRVGAE